MYSIPGHERQKNILEKYLTGNENLRSLQNLPNAILLNGEEGIGKFETGKDFAKKILGTEENFLRNFISIGEIFYEGQKDDVIAKTTNFPQEHRKKAKVKSNTISIEDIHKIIEISEKTSSGGKKVFLIKNIERMNNSAANAFLKTLEESKNSIFICTTENKNLLLPTIISRFQEIEFYKLSDSEIRQFLEDVLTGKNINFGSEACLSDSEFCSEKIKNFSSKEEFLENYTKYSFGKINLTKNFLEKNGKGEENFLEIKKIFEDGEKFLEEISYSKIYKRSEFLFKNKDKIKDEIFFLENFLDNSGKKFFDEKKFLNVYEKFLELKKGLKSNQNIKLIFDNFYFSVI